MVLFSTQMQCAPQSWRGDKSVLAWGMLLCMVSWEANSETDYCKGSLLGNVPKINICRESEISRGRSWAAVQ